MEQLHQAAAMSDEDEHVAVLHVASHPLMHHPAQRADALAHISPPRTQVVAHRVIKAEHGLQGFCPTIHAAHPQCRSRNGHADHWETEVSHRTAHRMRRNGKTVPSCGSLSGQGHTRVHLGSNTSCASNCRWNNMYLSAGDTT